jgi:NAD(P)-dependent dehydrogenase (short-subunit alcohol dehydrogenase family)
LDIRTFDGKVAVVTGAGSGIGASCAELLAARGAQVLVVDRDAAAAERVAAQIGDQARPHHADVTDAAACEAMVDEAVAAFGGLDIAVNNAGVGPGERLPVSETSTESWHRVMSVNVDGVFFCMRAEIRAMASRGGGAIVNMSSALGAVGIPFSASYVTSKHAVVGLTRAAALECAPHGIRINCVGPGVIETPLTGDAAEVRANIAALHPLGRLGQADEVAELVCFLASDAASFCTGGWYPVDAGWTAK